MTDTAVIPVLTEKLGNTKTFLDIESVLPDIKAIYKIPWWYNDDRLSETIALFWDRCQQLAKDIKNLTPEDCKRALGLVSVLRTDYDCDSSRCAQSSALTAIAACCIASENWDMLFANVLSRCWFVKYEMSQSVVEHWLQKQKKADAKEVSTLPPTQWAMVFESPQYPYTPVVNTILHQLEKMQWKSNTMTDIKTRFTLENINLDRKTFSYSVTKVSFADRFIIQFCLHGVELKSLSSHLEYSLYSDGSGHISMLEDDNKTVRARKSIHPAGTFGVEHIFASAGKIQSDHQKLQFEVSHILKALTTELEEILKSII